jgi:hypothetical protein
MFLFVEQRLGATRHLFLRCTEPMSAAGRIVGQAGDIISNACAALAVDPQA